MKILFHAIGDMNTASSRIRAYGFAKELKKYGINTEVLSGIPKYIRLDKILGNDIIYFQKASDVPSYIIHTLSRLIGKRTIFDLDDSIFLRDKGVVIQQYAKSREMMRNSHIVIVASRYLYENAKKLNSSVFLVPTSIDLQIYNPEKFKRSNNDDLVTIGWIGSGKSHEENLKMLVEPLKKVGKTYDIRFILVGSQGSKKIEEMFENLENVNVEIIENLDWSDPTQAPKEIAKFDVGVMPLLGNDWSKAHYYKTLEYMAMEIPAVVSAIGENNYIIKDGINGFLVSNEKEWIAKIKKLIEDEEFRKEMGVNGRETIEEKYSMEVNGKKLAKILISSFEGDSSLHNSMH